MMRGSLVLIVLVSLCTPLDLVAAEAECSVLKTKLTETLPTHPHMEISEDEWEEIVRIRPCISSYPWPKGLYFVDTEKDAGINPEEMRALRDRVSKLIEEYKENQELFGLSAMSEAFLKDDQTFMLFASWANDGGDLNLLHRFGTILLSYSLYREGLYAEAQTEIDSAFGQWDIAVHDHQWDAGDAVTYFSFETQDNMFVLLKYMVLARIDPSTHAEGQRAATEYASVRDVLSEEIRFLNDPGSNLLKNAGCLD